MAPAAKSSKLSGSAIVSEANNDFTNSFYQEMFPDQSEKNLIFSPFSLHMALGMLCQGAEDPTKEEMLEVLQFPDKATDEIIRDGYESVMKSFKQSSSPETFTLLTANRIYSRQGFNVRESYVDTLRNKFQADFVQLDLSSKEKSREAAAKINDWVETTTNHKIKDIVKPDELGTDTNIVLVNAIYFSGLWFHEFESDLTIKDDFHVTKSETLKCDMMMKEAYFPHANLPQLDADVVELPYQGKRLSMRIMLPKEVEGLARLKDVIGNVGKSGNRIVNEALDENRKKRSRALVELYLPKFKIEASIENITELLEDMGMGAFSEEANLSGIADAGAEDPELLVTKIIQKAFIDINERGTEAAAATKTELRCKSSGGAKPKTVIINVDHPFYFEIVDHNNNDLVIFFGHCYDPSK